MTHHVVVGPRANWDPLIRVARIGARGSSLLTLLNPGDFMYMGRSLSPGGITIHLYKHAVTRRYLNLDDGGHAYQWVPPRLCVREEGGVYRAMNDLWSAINELGCKPHLTPP